MKHRLIDLTPVLQRPVEITVESGHIPCSNLAAADVRFVPTAVVAFYQITDKIKPAQWRAS